MRKLINIIRSKIRLLLFLLWHDKQTKRTTKYIGLTTLSLIGALWGFPLGNLSSSGVMPPEIQKTIRITGTYLLSGIAVSLLIILVFLRYRKYNHPENLSSEELDNILHYMNESK